MFCRAPGKLTPLPPVGSGSGSTSGLSKHHSEGLRDELLRAGLLGPQAPAAPAADAAQQQLEAEGSAGSLASDRDSKAPAAAGMGGSMSDDSQASSNVTDSQEFPSWHGKVAAARLSGADRQQQQGGGSTQHAGSMGRELSQGEGDGSDDDSGARGRQQLLEAARRQLSNSSRSRSSSQGLGQQQQQQQRAGEMQVEVSGAELTLTSSGELDDDMIPEDISLPIDVSYQGSGQSTHPRSCTAPWDPLSMQLWGMQCLHCRLSAVGGIASAEHTAVCTANILSCAHDPMLGTSC